MRGNVNTTTKNKEIAGRRNPEFPSSAGLDDIIENESYEDDKETTKNPIHRAKSKFSISVLPDPKNYENDENLTNAIQAFSDETSGVSKTQSILSRGNVKSRSGKMYSHFSMTLPNSLPNSMESIVEDDSSCCARIICCPDFVRRQNVDEKFFKKLWCLNYSTLFKVLTNVMILVIFWGWLALWLGDLAWPGGKLFDLLFVTLIGYLVGRSLSCIPYLRLSPIVGMLLVGVIARNVYRNGKPLYQVAPPDDLAMLGHESHDLGDREDDRTSRYRLSCASAGNLRSFCLTFVMMRAGLQIDARKIATHGRTICRLGIVPGTVECIVVAIAAWNLIDVEVDVTTVKSLPFIYCLMAGAIVAVMSPVTAIQCALELEEQGYGKVIATIVYTATSIDSVYMVTIFSVFYSLALRLWSDESSEHHVKKSFQSIYALVGGALIGISFGIVLTFFPHRHSSFVFWFRIINLNLACIFCTCWGYSVANIGAGLMGTCATCLVAMTGWKLIDTGFKDAKRVRSITGVLWHIAQPFLVVGIGVEIVFAEWKIERVIWQICVLAIGLLSRCLSAVYVAHRHDMSWNESIFLALAWTPKGHIQAAIAPLAYQTLHMLYDEKTRTEQKFKEEIQYAEALMTISVMTVVIMGPMGSMLMMGFGPRLLAKHDHRHFPVTTNRMI